MLLSLDLSRRVVGGEAVNIFITQYWREFLVIVAFSVFICTAGVEDVSGSTPSRPCAAADCDVALGLLHRQVCIN